MSAVFTNGALASELQAGRSPAEALTNLNRAFYSHSRRGNFVSFLLASVDASRKTVVFANAGQVKPLYVGKSGPCWLNGNGVNFPLGMVEHARYNDRQVQLEAGDVIVFLTDGVTEAMNASKELFSQERMEAFMRRPDIGRLSAAQVIDEVMTEVRSHMATAPQHDDMTLVVMKVL
jgi:sigma-B regulation protein RsbU (phosphoserine phosphatase)